MFSPAERTLRDGNGEIVPLRSQSATLLGVLAARAGEVVSKETLVNAVWNGRAVGDDSLAQCVSDIRRALGDTARTVLQTHPRKGYALVPDHAPAPTATQPAIAVLAFDDLSAAPDRGFLGDAIGEGVITELARFVQFKTISRNSSFAFRDQPRDVRAIGRALGAAYVLEGSQQKIGDHLQVVAQLIDTRDGTHIWGETFTGTTTDLLPSQANIVRGISSTVGGILAHYVPKILDAGATAFDLNAQALNYLHAPGADRSDDAIRYFAATIDADPASPLGYLGLGFCFRNAAKAEADPHVRDTLFSDAHSMTAKAFAIAPNAYLTRYLRGHLFLDAGDLAMARVEYNKAKRLNPNFANVFVGAATLKIYAGDTKGAIADIRHGMNMDQQHPEWFHGQLAWALWADGDTAGAAEALRQKSHYRPSDHNLVAVVLAGSGDLEGAKQAITIFQGAMPDASLRSEREKYAATWTADGALDRWIDQLAAAGLPA